MQSTGEVIGLHTDARVATAKALVAAALVPPRPGPAGALALLTVADRDKALLGPLAAALATGRLPVRRHAGDARGAGGAGP